MRFAQELKHDYGRLDLQHTKAEVNYDCSLSSSKYRYNKL